MTQQFRPPAVPLVTVDPYFSVWSAADCLTDKHTTHWTNKRNSMSGMVRIDGLTRRFMGITDLDEESDIPEPDAMKQTSLEVTATSSKYKFVGDGILLEVDFTTPLLLDDLDLLSRPASYVTFRVQSIDGKPHDVQVYADITGEWCVNTPDQKIVWSRNEIGSGIEALRMGSEQQPVLQQVGDDLRIDWGYVYLAASKSETTQTAIQSYKLRGHFIESGALSLQDDKREPRAVADDTPVMAVLFDFGAVNETVKSEYAVLAYDDIHSIEYFNRPLDAYWRRSGMSFEDMLAAAFSQYDDIIGKCETFDKALRQESMEAGGSQYADILSLAYRQAIAAHKLVLDENNEVLFLSKECFSNGCIGTVDVSYPSIPLFLKFNPELVKGMMRPIFRYAGSEQWHFEFAPHDVGCYPLANGQVYGENKLEYQMPIEECGNMLIMAAAVCLSEQNADFAENHWELLTKWANYLIENGLDPNNQLCTDDFAGHLAHNANLSVKAIIGIGAYATLCRMLGKTEDMSRYSVTAKEMAGQWTAMADAGDHYKLTFDSADDTWSLKYNLVWDRLFGLHLFPSDILEKEIPYYAAKQNRYGTPLDSRNSYTKSDWLVWCASMAASKDDFAKMIAPLWDSLHESPSRVPLTDWYDTVTGEQVGFQNRTVVGGFYIKLLHPLNV
ncbi:glutaminase family protein [Bacillus sp. FJAT-26390]|uniref:glutaminase family protein n=1 Tax=Bacillus sp. FJAT-26390 TaxID=1743142 RepID=UPI000807DD79|nr:glutaminase family protein [Bacillus sp. FJAT-26390]OBZ16480.1 glutaminase [Bacillus sp. FJAT-26390]